MNFDKNIYKISLFFFFIAAVFGLLLRAKFAFPGFNLPYEKLIQSHSHIAFLGWAYLAVTGFILAQFISETERQKKSYTVLLSIICIAILLMSISFPYFGYKSFSIALLSIFGVSSVVLSVKIYTQLSFTAAAEKMIKWSLSFYVLSSLATWFLPVAIIKFGKEIVYFNTIYFYLHFLYNGFFVFALFGLLFKYFEKQMHSLNLKHFKIFINALIIGTFLSYVLSILWSVNFIFLNIIGGISALLLMLSFVYLFKIISSISITNKWLKFLYFFAFGSYSLKLLAQLLSAFPWFVGKTVQLKHFFIIGYLHLYTLGFLSVFILFYLLLFKKITLTFYSKLGIVFIVLGVVCTEILLFGSGFLQIINQTALPYYNVVMFGFSMLLVLGIFIETYKAFKV